MKKSSRVRNTLSGPSNIQHALLLLTGVSAASIGFLGDASAQKPEGTKAPAVQGKTVTVDSVPQPQNVQVQTPPQWKRVTIQLTKEQQAELAKQGVKTTKIDITTYDITQLSKAVFN